MRWESFLSRLKVILVDWFQLSLGRFLWRWLWLRCLGAYFSRLVFNLCWTEILLIVDHLDQTIILNHFVTLKCFQFVMNRTFLNEKLLSFNFSIHSLMHYLFLNLFLSMFEFLSSCFCVTTLDGMHVILTYSLGHNRTSIFKLLDFKRLWRWDFWLLSIFFVLTLSFF